MAELKSPVAWLTDAEYRRSPFPERALAQARGKVGVRELPVNRGFWVERFLASVGLGPGHAWCAAFVHWCLVEAGAPKKALPKAAGRVRSWRDWAAANGRSGASPKRGRLAYWLNKDGTGHIGLVAEASGGRVRTIEGNTNEAGAREGVAVLDKWRREGDWDGYIVLEGLA
jgi:hypothetical protein